MVGWPLLIVFLFGICWTELSAGALPHDQLQNSWTGVNDRTNENSNNLIIRQSMELVPPSQVWNIGSSILEMLSSLINSENQVEEGRGRLPFMIPVMYNLGIITTLLVVLTFSAVKGLALGIIILILSLHAKEGWKHNTTVHAPRPVLFHYHTSKPYSPSRTSYYPEPWERLGHGGNKTLASSMHQKYQIMRS